MMPKAAKAKAAMDARIREIMALPEATTSPNLAHHLAFDTDIEVDEVKAMLRTARKDGAKSVASGFASAAALVLGLPHLSSLPRVGQLGQGRSRRRRR